MKPIVFIIILAIALPYHSFAQEPCDYKVEIIVDGEEFEKDDFLWRIRATKIEGISTNITSTAEIENSAGNTVKKYKPWTSESISGQKTSGEYSPNLKSGSYKIIAGINVECNDTNPENNMDVKAIKIKSENYSEINISITSINLKPQNAPKSNDSPQASFLNGKVVYESSNEKAKGLILIFLLTLSILLNIVLIWKR